MKRVAPLLLVLAALTPFALAAQEQAPGGGSSPSDPGGPPPPPPPATCNCVIHCGNDQYWGGNITPAACIAKYNNLCGGSGGNISCPSYIPYHNIPSGFVIASDGSVIAIP
jgi:hypothetical protein